MAEEFNLQTGDLGDLEIKHGTGAFFYFYDRSASRLVKRFVLDDSKPKTTLYCVVTLIEKHGRFTPRLEFSRRMKGSSAIAKEQVASDDRAVTARVEIGGAHENFWKLIAFLRSCAEIDVPDHAFSLVGRDDAELVDALKSRESASLTRIVRGLISGGKVSLSQSEINQLLKRKERLCEFQEALDERPTDEGWWQHFFHANKWIFGYGLNYHIIGIEQSQPAYGGTALDGKGGQRGDFLGATKGDIGFTVLVEIKTPSTQLLAGSSEIRNGAWSLARDLTDALTQLQANIQTWENVGATADANRDRLEGSQRFTVKPKGILVVGALKQVQDSRTKRDTVQRFRMGLHGVEILTFDELYERARFIVESDAS